MANLTPVVLYDSEGNVAAPGVGTDILATDVSVGTGKNGSVLRISITPAGASIIKLVDSGGKTHYLNGKAACVADTAYIWDFVASSSLTYNVQLDTTDGALSSLIIQQCWGAGV